MHFRRAKERLRVGSVELRRKDCQVTLFMKHFHFIIHLKGKKSVNEKTASRRIYVSGQVKVQGM